jgi:diguanylate cyclase
VTLHIDSSMLDRLVRALERRSTRFWAVAAVAVAVAGVAVATGLGFLAGGRGWAIALSVSLFFGFFALALAGIAIRLARAVAEGRARHVLQAVDDALTGLSNRRHFLQLVDREFARCRRYGDEGALLLIDADHLRRINEHLGQLCGDALLLEVTKRVGATLRQPDLLARFGGAELSVFLPNTDPLGALDAAERIRQQVASSPYQWQQTHVVATVSIGVATVHQGQLSVDTMVHEAEAALEAAKEAGRNCVRTGPIKPRRNGEKVTPSSS